MEKKNQYKHFDWNKINKQQMKIISSKEALADVTPFDWSKDVLFGKQR